MSLQLPTSWHHGPQDSFHGEIIPEGPFLPEVGRYHLYLGLFCPFAHRVNLVYHLKRLAEYAQIQVSIVRPYPKGEDGWCFNVSGEPEYEGATEDAIHGVRFLHELYTRADPDYNGRITVPLLWDKKLDTIVNNESHELLRNLQCSFNAVLPSSFAHLSLYQEQYQPTIDSIGSWMQSDLNTGVYKTGYAADQKTYEQHLIRVFAALNKLEKLAAANGGPYLLGNDMTELDIRLFATVIRFDSVYAQHFKCNLGTLRHDYPILNNWMKNLFHNHAEFRGTTYFQYIKDCYFKVQPEINPKLITPIGPWPHVEEGYEEVWQKLSAGGVQMPEVLAAEEALQV